jgi:GDPmannose 4,6-dehydratase
VVNYREGYNVFASNGILFNHESERRGKTFVTRKITVGASKIILGQQEKLFLGNIDAKRDWGYAPEYVEGMWRILQAEKPDDFVLATNETHSIREFIEETFNNLGEEIVWRGKGIDETGIIKSSGKEVIRIDPRYFRPTEVDLLVGNPAKAMEMLGWKPKTTFRELVKIMVASDFEKAKRRLE